MPKFLLALRDDPAGYANITPEKMQALIAKYEEWAGGLAGQGRLVGGHKLKENEGKFLDRSSGDLVVKDGPFGETKEVLGGYYIIKAADYGDAVKVCENHPSFVTGGTVEIRELDFMGQPDPDE